MILNIGKWSKLINLSDGACLPINESLDYIGLYA